MTSLPSTTGYDSTKSTGNPTTTKTFSPLPNRETLTDTGRDECDSANGPLTPSNRPKTNAQVRSYLKDDDRRDSGLAPSSHDSLAEHESASSLKQSPSLPNFSSKREVSCSSSPASQTRRWGLSKLRPQHTISPDPIPPPVSTHLTLTTEIPTTSFEDLKSLNNIKFSNRGSMLIGGKKVNGTVEDAKSTSEAVGSKRKPSGSLASSRAPVPTRILSTDDEALSNKVRSMYQAVLQRRDTANRSPRWDPNGTGAPHQPSSPSGSTQLSLVSQPNGSWAPEDGQQVSSAKVMSIKDGQRLETDNEAAGGIEDWENLNKDDVDRYGFIVPRKVTSRGSPSKQSRGATPEPPRLQRVSTALQLASEAPRRQHSKLQRRRSTKSPARSATAGSDSRSSSRLDRPNSSQSSYRGNLGSNSTKIRSATNRLPHNRARRAVDEAGDMLTLPPGLADIAENDEDNHAVNDLKRKEIEREDKWRKMAKPVKKVRDGGGMEFEFDTRSPKLIERTWKGIPDRWRATAWHAFLSASAKKSPSSLNDAELIAIFDELLEQGSPDDVQIDLDVPRTINSHIMFRKRYRGGQRLLFRVLHCLSIYFPETGYVQGMAAITATLLCYFDEQMTFVMLVRLWQLRGLEALYKSGFSGLMTALEDFEKGWLAGGDVAIKLEELGITPTAYGTRWYLTLFNYSLPFPAQLRVWDVFMLLGDSDLAAEVPTGSLAITKFHGVLDVLHATAAALIDGTREILLDSDFENAMKVLTSWIPVKDEDLLMRVAKAEWKVHRRKP